MQENETKFHLIPEAPTPVGPFCHATERDGWITLTGQMPTDPDDDDAPLPDGVQAQTTRVMENLILVLKGLGIGLEDVVSAGIYLTEFKRDFYPMNDIYMAYFPADRRPARTCIGVTALAVDALVEIDFVARRPAS